MATFHEERQQKKLETLRLREEEELAKILSGKYGLAYIDLSRETVDTDALALLKEEAAREAQAAAFHKSDKEVSVAVRAPNNQHVKEVVADLESRGFNVMLYMASQASLARAHDHYKDVVHATETEAGVLDISHDNITKTMEEIKTLGDVRVQIQDVLGMKKLFRISRALEILIGSALSQGASDIHVEPQETDVRIRFRLDGVLTDIVAFDRETYQGVLTRIKLISGLKLNIKNEAQDGRFSVRVSVKEVEIRTSILPGNYGESIVLRLLDPTQISLGLEELGMRSEFLSMLEREISKPNGMLLNTGPTGSGKTTTLYALLKRIHTPDIKIITIEDPIEYHLTGLVQTQVNRDYSFAQGLRSTLRQDPDVIMIGEIRDEEVATTALQAALTGHLVFSTLHTNDAAGAFPRMLDLGVDANNLTSAMNVSMAQRLVRTLDDRYKEPYPLAGEELAFVEKVLAGVEDKNLIPQDTKTAYRPVAPEGETGYKGRVGVYEAVLIDEQVERVVRERGSSREIREAARGQRIPTMQEDAVLKALAGITTIEEVGRVVGF